MSIKLVLFFFNFRVLQLKNEVRGTRVARASTRHSPTQLYAAPNRMKPFMGTNVYCNQISQCRTVLSQLSYPGTST